MPEPLTVLMVHNYSSWGGNLATVLALCAGLREHGVNVLAAFPASQPYVARFLDAGITVFDAEVRSKWDVGSVARYRRIIRKNRVDVVHTHTRRADMAAGIAGRDGRTATITTHHGQINLDGTTFEFKNDISARVYNYILRKFFAVNVAVSEEIAHELYENCGVPVERIRRIPNGIDPEPFTAPVNREAVRAEYGFAPGHVVVTLVGSIDRKGHRELTEAVAVLRSDFPDARYLYVGEGPREREVAEQVSLLGVGDVVRMTGFVDDVPAVLAASDVFCLPSYSEGLSISVMEAMAAGLPVAASRVGGNPELIIDGETGLIFESFDPGDLADKLAKLLGNTEARRAMGEAGRRRVLSEFTLDDMVRRYDDMYSEVVKN
ncbi:MAG: glycosyltransferase family 4 protein [Candidatus Coatesbacteria bacterium]|nr:MAG: glycosyltransferase family 4 protein [Candidatus Coatesbacteria bacterium]